MRPIVLSLSLFIVPVASLNFCFAQIVTGASTTIESGTQKITMNFSPRPFAPNPVAGQPYSADRINERVQTLADGTHINQHSTLEKVFRDSLGRERAERMMMAMPMNRNQGVPVVEITDPIAGYRYVLDDANKVAHRTQVEMPRVRPGAARSGAAPTGMAGEILGAMPSVSPLPPGERPAFSHEDLGTQTIEGVLAHGRKSTTTYPVGFQGNDRPIIATSEFWTAEDLKVIVLSKHNDPRSGESTMRLTNISRTEPDPALFQPPADYKIVDETGPFTIEVARPAK